MKIKAEVEKGHYETMEEPIPDQLTEKLQQISSLEDSIKVSLLNITRQYTESSCQTL